MGSGKLVTVERGTLERLLRGVTLIPGTTEFGYSVTPVSSGSTKENVRAGSAVADIVRSLDQLAAAAPALRHVSLVVAWHGDDLRCGECEIRPRVETDEKTTTPYAWRVGPVTRDTAVVVSEVEGKPSSGSAPADRSVFEAIAEIKRRGWRVTLYPFILMDVPAGNSLANPYGGSSQPAYPWRGRITCHPAPGQGGTVDKTGDAATQVAAFFGEAEPEDFGWNATDKHVTYAGPAEWSFRRFVLHLAQIAEAAGGVDTFLIGSELVGLTTVRSDADTYPAVGALIALAADVRGMLGADVAISYAADWSEYHSHRPGDGSGDLYFHLDPVWADENIDFIGIDNYLPIADWRDGTAHLDAVAGAASQYDIAYLQEGIEGGEYADWYYASSEDRAAQIRTPITDGGYGKPWVYGNKALRDWWLSAHRNRPGGTEAGSPTAWVPQGKPIRFTEIGCPAVDKGANQPNVFVDAKSSESQSPHFSSGLRDDRAQRAFLEASLGYWMPGEGNNPVSTVTGAAMIDWRNTTVWTWDARPYPAFPNLTALWADGENWARGHWLTGRALPEAGHRPGRRGSVRRFEPRLWTTDFNLATSGAIITRGRDGFDVATTIRRNQDLGAAIWDTAFAFDHPWFRPDEDNDFTGVTWEFTLEVKGDGAPLAGVLGPSLAITTENDGVQYVRLWKCRVNEDDGDIWRNRFRITFDETLLQGFGASGDPVAVDEITRIVIPAVPRDFQGGATCTLRTEIVQDGTYSTVAVTIPGGRQPLPGDVLSIWPFTMATDDHTQLYINSAAPAGSGYPADTFIITPAPAFTWPYANTIPVGAACQITSSADAAPLRDQNEVVLRLRDLVVSGDRASLVADRRRLKPHSLGMTDGWDNAYPLTPELVVERFRDLGYTRLYVMYVGMSHPQSFVWDAGLVRDGETGGWVIDPDLPPVNRPTRIWFEDFARRLAALGIELWISVSFEILNMLCPPDWRQLDADGNPALTGWDPPSSLVSVANLEARAYLGDLAIDFITICRRQGCRVAYQIGEPWTWISAFEPGKPSVLLPPEDWVPFIYDPHLTAAWTAETGLPVPTPQIRSVQIDDAAFAANADYFAFCRGLLGETTNDLTDRVLAAQPGIDTAILVFTPQVLDTRTNVAPALNLPPVEQWGASRFTYLMIEDYDWVILGLRDEMKKTWAVAADLGYPVDRTFYFSGFVLLAENAATQWPLIFDATNDAISRGALQVMPWSREQVWRDGVVWEEPVDGGGAVAGDIAERDGWIARGVDGLGTRVKPGFRQVTPRVTIDVGSLRRTALSAAITGTAAPGARIVLLADGALLPGEADADGAWSVVVAVDDIGPWPIAVWQATGRGIHVPATGTLVVDPVAAPEMDFAGLFSTTMTPVVVGGDGIANEEVEIEIGEVVP